MTSIKMLLLAGMSTLAMTTSLYAQSRKAPAASSLAAIDRPKLVVGIVIDQMRYDYLYRYYDMFGEGGFRRMMDKGFNCRNNHYHYAATYTGPGHAAIYTGSAPALNGIVGNDFYDRNAGRMMYCAEDTTATTVGNTGSAGKMSPQNMLVTTITDQLKLATDGRAKVIGIALKDRGAILPAGHAADAAYWFDSKDGNWISSSFYQKDLPQWAKEFNAKKRPDTFLSQKWEASLDMAKYTASTVDDEPFENNMPGETTSVFPHAFAVQAGGAKYEGLRTSPYGDELTKEFALAALKGEQMGKDDITDFLAVSFSSSDYVGHAFGTHAIETEDEYIRLDRQLADLFDQLDATVGKGNYLSFLSADHGAADVPGFSQLYKIPAQVKSAGEVSDAVKAALAKAYGPERFMLAYYNQEIYLDNALLAEKKIPMNEVYALIRATLLKQKGIINVLNFHDLGSAAIPELQLTQLRNVYHPNRSGDFYVMMQAGWFEGRNKGTTHGTTYAYDTHVPLLFYGWHIKPGQTTRRTQIADIAPTLAAMLGILEPSGSIGMMVEEVMK